jgi:hypothetical protein
MTGGKIDPALFNNHLQFSLAAHLVTLRMFLHSCSIPLFWPRFFSSSVVLHSLSITLHHWYRHPHPHSQCATRVRSEQLFEALRRLVSWPQRRRVTRWALAVIDGMARVRNASMSTCVYLHVYCSCMHERVCMRAKKEALLTCI